MTGREPRLVVLGAGTALPRADEHGRTYGPCGLLLELERGGDAALVDCGPGTVRSLAQHDVPLERVRQVFVTHFHLDHCLDLFALLFARRNPRLSALPLDVFGPRGIAALLRGPGLELGAWVEGDALTVHELDAGTLRLGVAAGDLLVQGHPTGHTLGSVCYRFTLPGGFVLCFSGDSVECPALIEAARDADLFVCECSSPDGDPLGGHLTPSQVERLVREAGPARVVLTHAYPGLEPEAVAADLTRRLELPVEAAHDGWSRSLVPG